MTVSSTSATTYQTELFERPLRFTNLRQGYDQTEEVHNFAQIKTQRRNRWISIGEKWQTNRLSVQFLASWCQL